MDIIIDICAFIGTLLGVLQLYKVIYAFGVLTHKKYEVSEVKHCFGICVAARNEDKVITGLLESIDKQDYDKDKIKIFICAHNCTDNTANVCREYAQNSNVEITVFEHNCSDEKTKGFALRHLFNKIKESNLDENIDGYFVFDADNVLKCDYVSKMNDAYSAGNKIVTSFRNSKNFSQNWISFSYAMHWLKTCLLEHRGTTLFNLSCRIQGTGFLFDKELVKDGWIWTSLTEDRAFCTDAVIKNYKVSYCEEAEFFDEQPYSLKVALRQRLRWAKGHLQSTVENEPKLLKNMAKFNKNFMVYYNTFWLNFPGAIESLARKIITFVCDLIICIISVKLLGFIQGTVTSFAINVLKRWLRDMLFATLTLIIYRKKIIHKTSFANVLFNVFMYPWFYVIGDFCMYVALFKKVEWKPIPHDVVVNLDEINQTAQENEAIQLEDNTNTVEDNRKAS